MRLCSDSSERTRNILMYVCITNTTLLRSTTVPAEWRTSNALRMHGCMKREKHLYERELSLKSDC
jgi:hypothetical protein